ncbi:MAG: PQQ-binding-like beta-propeller repeat protein [Bacteroidetes bacterium]|nr:PQQ-binding-like beta-propeller repeat protein [Bacteroidota bacterium]
MKLKNTFLLFIAIVLISHGLGAQNTGGQWPGYRGYYASGVLDHANLPGSWDINKGTNIKWKVKIPGLGLSSPVIWNEQLFITTAISEKDKEGLKVGIYGNVESVDDESEHEWKVLCINKYTGQTIWERTSCKGVPQIKRHSKSSHANSSIATDGQYVVAFFGSEGLFCYDMHGELIWTKNFGKLKSVFFAAESAEWEFASSPIIHKGILIIQCDVMEKSFVAAFDITNGKEIWKKKRDEYPGWCTPNIYTDNEQTRVVVNGYKHRGAYDFESGKEIWKMSGGGDIPIPTPIIGSELIYFNSAHGKSSPILAVKKSAVGDISLKKEETSNEYIAWSKARGGAYMQSMLLYQDYLYNFRWNGTVYCLNAITGEELYKEKLGKASSFTASAVVSDNKIYVAEDNGRVYVVQAGPEFKLLATNYLRDICMVTPAITEGIIYFRTSKYLIAISKDE